MLKRPSTDVFQGIASTSKKYYIQIFLSSEPSLIPLFNIPSSNNRRLVLPIAMHAILVDAVGEAAECIRCAHIHCIVRS